LNTPLYDMSARFYAPGIGAFTQLDSVMGSAQNPLSMNRFLYALANPATMIDPDGHLACAGWDDDCHYQQKAEIKRSTIAKKHYLKLKADRGRRLERDVESRRNPKGARRDRVAVPWTAKYAAAIADIRSHPSVRDEMAEDVRLHADEVGYDYQAASYHDVLDDVGYLPIAGTPADIGNAAGYTLEGDWGNALLSLAAILPVGDAIKASRKAARATLDFAEGAVRASKPSSRALARNLIDAGVERPAGVAAHHIVAGSADEASEARAVLQSFDIDINSAENGIFLPANKSSPNSLYNAVHSTVHTDQYFVEVNRLLAGATSREDAISALAYIKAQLAKGDWPP
jgi:RHS repeat-associated protein